MRKIRISRNKCVANVNYGDLNKASLKELEEDKQNINVAFEPLYFKLGNDSFKYDKREVFDNVH